MEGKNWIYALMTGGYSIWKKWGAKGIGALIMVIVIISPLSANNEDEADKIAKEKAVANNWTKKFRFIDKSVLLVGRYNPVSHITDNIVSYKNLKINIYSSLRPSTIASIDNESCEVNIMDITDMEISTSYKIGDVNSGIKHLSNMYILEIKTKEKSIKCTRVKKYEWDKVVKKSDFNKDSIQILSNSISELEAIKSKIAETKMMAKKMAKKFFATVKAHSYVCFSLSAYKQLIDMVDAKNDTTPSKCVFTKEPIVFYSTNTEEYYKGRIIVKLKGKQGQELWVYKNFIE